MVVRRIEIELDPDEDAGPKAIDVAEVRRRDRLLRNLQHEHLLWQGLFDLPWWDLEAADWNLEFFDEPTEGRIRKTPVILLGARAVIFPAA